MIQWPVHMSPMLPLPAPEKGSPEWVVRYVRAGLADVLEWLGEDPGPDPDEETNALWIDGHVYVSQEAFDQLKELAR